MGLSDNSFLFFFASVPSVTSLIRTGLGDFRRLQIRHWAAMRFGCQEDAWRNKLQTLKQWAELCCILESLSHLVAAWNDLFRFISWGLGRGNCSSARIDIWPYSYTTGINQGERGEIIASQRHFSDFYTKQALKSEDHLCTLLFIEM